MTFRHIGAIGLCALAIACQKQVPSPATPAAPIHSGTAVEFVPLSAEIVSPFDGGVDIATRVLLKSHAEWEALWRQIEPRTSRIPGQVEPNPLPQINFSEHALIVAAMGMKPDGCCSVEILSVVETADRLLVTILEKKAGADCTVTLGETRPIALGVIKQTPKQAEFEVLNKTQDC